MRFIKQCVQILFHVDVAGILVEAINVVLLTLFFIVFNSCHFNVKKDLS